MRLTKQQRDSNRRFARSMAECAELDVRTPLLRHCQRCLANFRAGIDGSEAALAVAAHYNRSM